MKYKAVIFDSFGVLYNDWSFQLFEELEDDEKSHKIRALMDRRDVDDIEENAYKRAIEEVSGRSFKSLAEGMQGKPNQTIVDLTKKMKQAGYKVALLSNSHRDYLNFLFKRDGLTKLFDAVIASSEVKAMKPDAVIYEAMLQRLNIKPGEAIFIDDRPHNVEGAKKVGMESFQFIDNEQLKRELSDRLELLNE